MPFTEFISGGDLKFMITFSIFTIFAFYQFMQKLKHRKNENNSVLIEFHNAKINYAVFWIMILSVLSLLLGFMHSLYFIGKAGGMAPNMMFNGMSYALITPVSGIGLLIFCKILSGIFNK